MEPKNYKKVVIKVGSALLTDDKNRLNEGHIKALVDIISDLWMKGIQVVLVSSGAMAAGMGKIDVCKFGKTLPIRQTYSSVGQPVLMNEYIKCFDLHGIKVAQALLTKFDFEDRQHFLNTRDLLNFLLQNGVLPIVNENDVTSVYELQFGDNDRLAAKVATIIGADLLILLTDVDGFYTRNPKKHEDAKIIHEVKDINTDLKEYLRDDFHHLLKGKGKVSFGGMTSKIMAAHMCQMAGVEVVITNGFDVNNIRKIVEKEKIGTKFIPTEQKQDSYKKWLVSQAIEVGIIMDDDAVEIIQKGQVSLLAVGIDKKTGDFREGDVITVYSHSMAKIAIGMIRYSSDDIDKIKGKKSQEYEAILGHNAGAAVIHRDNLVLV